MRACRWFFFVLNYDDFSFRVRTVPMQVRRPTHQETIRIHTSLTQLVPYVLPLPIEAHDLDQPHFTPLSQDQSLSIYSHPLQHQCPTPHEPTEEKWRESDRQTSNADEDNETWKSLVIACNKSQLPRLKTAVMHGEPSIHCIRSDGCSLLHIAASAGSWRVVDLLIDAGVSPLPRDRRRKSAYDVAKDKDTRDAFRRAM
jgi:hypothetical protein